MTDWFDKNTFQEILATIDSNKFNYRNKIGEFKYTGIRKLVNNIRDNTISKIDAKKDLNTLNKIKNAEIIKHKNHTPKHKKLLNLFNNLLDIILTDKTLMLSKDKNENEDHYENGNENEDDYENETMNQNNSDKIKELTGTLNEIIDKSKSFEDQTKLLKKLKV